LFRFRFRFKLLREQPDFVAENMGQWPVVHLNFGLRTPCNVAELVAMFTEKIFAAFNEHKYLQKWLKWLGADSRTELNEFERYLNRNVKISEAARDGRFATKYHKDFFVRYFLKIVIFSQNFLLSGLIIHTGRQNIGKL
jgi:hypothetical protein